MCRKKYSATKMTNYIYCESSQPCANLYLSGCASHTVPEVTAQDPQLWWTCVVSLMSQYNVQVLQVLLIRNKHTTIFDTERPFCSYPLKCFPQMTQCTNCLVMT